MVNKIEDSFKIIFSLEKISNFIILNPNIKNKQIYFIIKDLVPNINGVIGNIYYENRDVKDDDFFRDAFINIMEGGDLSKMKETGFSTALSCDILEFKKRCNTFLDYLKNNDILEESKYGILYKAIEDLY